MGGRLPQHVRWDQQQKERDDSLSGPLAGTDVNFNINWFDTLTGRLGYSFAPAWLIYGQGGGAWAHASTECVSCRYRAR